MSAARILLGQGSKARFVNDEYCSTGQIEVAGRMELGSALQIVKARLCFGCICAVAILASCGLKPTATEDYVKTVQSGIEFLRWPKQMETLFGEGEHFITHYGFSSGPKQWNTEVDFYGRYTLTLQVMVDFDKKTGAVVKTSEPPKFYLLQTETVTMESGLPTSTFSGQWIFGADEWKKLVEAKGDWAVLNIPVKTNAPVPGFQEVVKRKRDFTLKIPH